MSVETVTIIVSNLVGWAALGGYLWKSLGAVEDKVDDGFRHVNQRLDLQSDRIDTQNGRIGQVERSIERRKGFQEGYDQARAKYDPKSGDA